jgi:dGTPase
LLELETFLHHHVYKHARIVRMDDKARRIIKRVFRDLAANPAKLPPRFADRVETQGAPRVIADYVAGMTDRFILRLHRRMANDE